MTRTWDDAWRPPAAAEQEGVFTVAQAVAAGMGRRTAQRRARATWTRVAGAGFTALPVRTPGALQQAWAAVLTWPAAVVAGPTAARLHGIPAVPADPGQVHVLLPRCPRPRPGLLVRSAELAAGDVTTVCGLAVTSRRRTLLDCLALAPDLGAAEDLLAWACSRGALDRAALAAAVRFRYGRPGTARLRTLLAGSADGAANGAERRLHAVLRRGGLAGWRAGARVTGADGSPAVVDVLFERERVVVELDGWAAHGGRAAFQRDRRRQNALVAAGYVVLRFTWPDVRERPDAVVAGVRAALALRAPALPRS